MIPHRAPQIIEQQGVTSSKTWYTLDFENEISFLSDCLEKAKINNNYEKALRLTMRITDLEIILIEKRHLSYLAKK